MLELYHFGPVANSLTPLLCLLEKGIPFENRVLNSRLWEHHTPEFQQLSPEGMVPILVHDGRVVRESTVINEYIDSVWPDNPLRPADPWLRAEMRVPGSAWLELGVTPTDAGAEYRQRAVFFPQGLTGRLYWLAMLPFHGLIFSGMVSRIVAEAEEA